ncbi:MAG: radical SAM protein [Candidatus Brocadia sp.]|nr:radical SAM protein [Candidatus Brocadia sp.]
MSIVLLEPPRPKNPNRFEDVVNAPLSACLFTGYISSVLREYKIEIEITNAYLYDWSIEQTITYLLKKNPALLCVHVVYLWERTLDVFDMLLTIKSNNLAMHINLYGYYPTFAYKKILEKFPFIDSITIGEPEFTTLDLARHVLSEKDISGELDIPGLAFRNRNGKVVFHPRPPIQDLDRLPYPDRHDIALYQKKGITAYIQGSRGCYGRCTFCYLNPFYGQISQWRGRSAKNVFDEILKLYTEHAIENFYFSDANFFGPGKPGKERAITLAELILANNLDIRFGLECRANDIEEYTLSRLVMAGLTNVFLGLESGDPASLKRFKKHATVGENKKAIQLLREYGIEPTFGFIMFEPNSTMESVRNNYEFLKEMDIMTTPAVTAHLLHHRQTIFEGTPDYQSMMINATDTSDTFTNYEAFYKIKDLKVEAFSEVISHVCRITLSLLPKHFDCEANASTIYMKPTMLLDAFNNTLIALFEKTLSCFETNTILCRPDTIKELSQKLVHEVEAISQSLSLLQK